MTLWSAFAGRDEYRGPKPESGDNLGQPVMGFPRSGAVIDRTPRPASRQSLRGVLR